MEQDSYRAATHGNKTNISLIPFTEHLINYFIATRAEEKLQFFFSFLLCISFSGLHKLQNFPPPPTTFLLNFLRRKEENSSSFPFNLFFYFQCPYKYRGSDRLVRDKKNLRSTKKIYSNYYSSIRSNFDFFHFFLRSPKINSAIFQCQISH